MKKKFTKMLSVMFALTLFLSLFATVPVSAAENEFAAKLGFANSDWSAQEWGDNANTTVKGAGTYTLSWDGAASDALVFVVDIEGAQTALSAEGKTYSLTALTVTADGTDLGVDLSKVVTGDLEEKGNWRIEIYNEYGTTKENPPVDPATVTFASNLTVTFTIEETDYVEEGDGNGTTDNDAAGDGTTAVSFDPAGSYNAYLLLQTPNWTYRDAWNSDNGIGSDYFGNFIYGNETSEKYGVVTDTVVAGNGTYAVSITDFGTIFSDDFTAAGQDYFNILGISTDIPLSDSIKITDVKLVIDGQTRHTYKEAYLDPDATEYVTILVQNIWNEDVKEISYYPTPSSTVEIQFTISGFSYDNEAAGAGDSAVADTEDDTHGTSDATDTAGDTNDSGSNVVGIVIAVVVVVVIAAAVVAVVMKKKKD